MSAATAAGTYDPDPRTTSGEQRPGRSGGYGSSSSAVIAALARVGQKLGSLRSGAGYF